MTDKGKQEAMHNIDTFLKFNVYRNPDIMFCDGADIDGKYHIADVIAALQDFIHILIENKPYDYAWHWANKIGSWIVSDDVYEEMTERRCE